MIDDRADEDNGGLCVSPAYLPHFEHADGHLTDALQGDGGGEQQQQHG